MSSELILVVVASVYGFVVTLLLVMSRRKITQLRCDTSTLAVVLYRAAGIKVNDGLSEKPDHFSVEFDNASISLD